MGIAPGADITHDIDRFARRPRLRVKVGNLLARRRVLELTALVKESDAVYFRQGGVRSFA